MDRAGAPVGVRDPLDFFNPENTPFDANLHALDQYNEQKWDECMDYVTETCRNYPPSMTTALRSIKGNVLRASGRQSEALAEFEEIAYLDPHNVSNLKCTASVLYLQGRHKDCLGLCDEIQALQTNRVDVDQLRLRAQCYASTGDFAQACGAWKQVALAKPSVDVYLAWVEVCQQMGDVATTTSVLTKALSIYPQDHQLLVVFAKLHVRAGNIKNTFEYLRRALVHSPLSREANILLGSLLQNEDDFAGALQKYRLGARGPDQPDPSKQMPQTDSTSRMTHRTAALRDKHMELQRSAHNMHSLVKAEQTCSPEVWSNLALCFLGTGKYTAALTTIQHALLLDPFTWTLHHNYGLVALALGLNSVAFSAFTAALTLSGGAAPSLPLLAIALARMNELPTALNVYQRVFEVQPNDPIQYLNVCVGLLRMKNQSQNLAVYFKKFQELYKPDPQNHAVEKARQAVIHFIQKGASTSDKQQTSAQIVQKKPKEEDSEKQLGNATEFPVAPSNTIKPVPKRAPPSVPTEE